MLFDADVPESSGTIRALRAALTLSSVSSAQGRGETKMDMPSVLPDGTKANDRMWTSIERMVAGDE